MPRTITDEEMRSRQRIARLESAITDAISGVSDVTYAEVLVATTYAAHRWAGLSWKQDFAESEPTNKD